MTCSRRTLWTIPILCLAAATTVTAQEGVLSQIPEEYRSGVSSALGRGNRTALIATFNKLEGDEKTGWAFLLANMSPRNTPKLTEPLLTEHLKYAYKARAEFAWTKALPEEVFHHYVLPILSGDEKLEAWRKQFYDEIRPVLRKRRCKSLEQVALEVNRWCGQRVTFKGSPPEDASPLETLSRGYGRCEEEAIFYNAVARSAGVPARVASTPYWTMKASNHAWSEVYVGKGRKAERAWGYVGACEPSGKLNQAWFTGQIKRAALVLSRTIGTPKSEQILSNRGTVSVINTTMYYTKTCQMTLVITDADENPAPNAQVAFYIFNEVGNEPYMRSCFEGRADDKGNYTFDVGPGDYLVQAKSGGNVGWNIAKSAPGKKAECAIVLGTPGPESGEAETKEGTGSRVLLKAGGGAGKCRIAVTRLGDLPWKPVKWVEFDQSGQTIDLAPGSYILQSATRKGDSAVHMTLLPVKVADGETTVVVLPGRFPKRPPKGLPKDGAYVLTYPRK